MKTSRDILKELLREIRECSCMAGIRQINEYKEGKVVDSGRKEFYCEDCGETADWYSNIQHKWGCLLYRIDDALKNA